jgi:protein disulfide-isomerase A1
MTTTYDTLAVYYGDSTEDWEYSTFTAVAMASDTVKFAHSFNADLRKAEKAKEHSVVFYKNFDEKRVDFDQEITFDKLKEWVL